MSQPFKWWPRRDRNTPTALPPLRSLANTLAAPLNRTPLTPIARHLSPSDTLTPDGGATWSRTHAKRVGMHTDRQLSNALAAQAERQAILDHPERQWPKPPARSASLSLSPGLAPSPSPSSRGEAGPNPPLSSRGEAGLGGSEAMRAAFKRVGWESASAGGEGGPAQPETDVVKAYLAQEAEIDLMFANWERQARMERAIKSMPAGSKTYKAKPRLVYVRIE